MRLLSFSSRLAVLALAAATGAHAAELGEASVRSFSGQPLSADIELTDLTTQELADLQARLARPDVFQGANVTMNPALAGANITVVRRDSRRILHVTTTAPVKAEVLHLYFQLVSGGRERVRGVSLWLSPDPNPAPVPAPVTAPTALAAAPTPATETSAKSVPRRTTPTDATVQLVATALPGKESTPRERALLGAVEQAFASRAPAAAPRETKPARSMLTARQIRDAALKHASTADDFKRGGKPAKPLVAHHELEQPAPQEEKKAPARSFLASKADLAEAARATRAGVEQGRAPERLVKAAAPAAGSGPVAAPVPAGQADAAMLTKLAELEGKLKRLQTQLGMTNTAGAATVTAPMTPLHATAPASLTAAAAPAPAPVSTAAAAPASAPAPAPVAAASDHAVAQHLAPVEEVEPASEHVTASAVATSAAAVATVEEPKEAAPKPAAEAPPPEPDKDMKISRPRLLTFLFAGSLVLLVIFGVIVHFIRKAKMRRSPIVRQSWSRDEDDTPARSEPTAEVAPAPAAPSQT